jgi:hypothetical protein
MSSIVSSQKRPLDEDLYDALQCLICVEDFDCEDHIPYQCGQCTNYPICEKCYKIGCNSKPMNCPQCQCENPFKPDRTILRIVRSIIKKREICTQKLKEKDHKIIPINELCLAFFTSNTIIIPDLLCMCCGTNVADVYCEDEESAFFSCKDCNRNRFMRQVSIQNYLFLH